MRNRWGISVMIVLGALVVACGDDEAGTGATATATVVAGAATPARPDVSAFRSLAPDWTTDFTRASVAAGEFRSGGPGKDGIPAIDEPQFIGVDDADFLADVDPVLALEVGDEARAYPLQILIWHEIVNDTIAGRPIAVTYCPLCNSSVVFERTAGETVLDFGVSGFLRNSDLVMFDRQTESWWQQITGEALVGAYSGTVLDTVPASTIAFSEFRSAYPEGLVLSRETGFSRSYGSSPYSGYDAPGSEPFLFEGDVDERLEAVDRIVAVESGAEVIAYPFSRLLDNPVVNDTIGDVPIVVFYRPGVASPLDRSSIAESKDVGQGVVFLRTVNGMALTFEHGTNGFRDVETGSTWNIAGQAIAGPLSETQLEPVVHGNHFWFAWAVFKPETRVWQPEEAQ